MDLAPWRPTATAFAPDAFREDDTRVLARWALAGLCLQRIWAPRNLHPALFWAERKVADFDSRGHAARVEPQWEGAVLPQRGQDDGRGYCDSAWCVCRHAPSAL